MINYKQQAYDALRRELTSKIEEKLASIGLFFRIFSRVKSADSTKLKLTTKKETYALHNKKMQDFIGIRVTVYFEEDICNVERILNKLFTLNSSSKTPIDSDNFSPKNFNLVFDMPHRLFPANPNADLIDNTFEVQIRTIFSEGWHEIEHDLRYKNKTQWEKHPDQSRGLNAIHATLEMCDWGMTKLSDEMAYNAYKSNDLQSLLIHKLKLRLASNEICTPFIESGKDAEFLKRILRIDRNKLIEFLSNISTPIPINANNILWILAKTQNITSFNETQIPLPLHDYF